MVTSHSEESKIVVHSITSSARLRSDSGNGQPEGLGGLEVDDQFELGRLLHGEIARAWPL